MAKVVAVMAVLGRTLVLRETVRLLRLQAEVPEIVIVGSTQEDKDNAKRLECRYVEHANQPLSEKYQAGISFARTLKPEYLLIEGSDSWLSSTWIAFYLHKLETNQSIGLVGQSGGITITIDKKPYPAYERRYLKQHRVDPVGPGRIYKANALDKINWKLYPDKCVRNLDYLSFNEFLGSKYKCDVIDRDIPCLVGVRSSAWSVMNPYRTNFRKDRHHFRLIKDVESELSTRFPEALNSIETLRKEFKL